MIYLFLWNNILKTHVLFVWYAFDLNLNRIAAILKKKGKYIPGRHI